MIVAITSMKGGVGKTEVALNLAMSVKKSGRTVVLVDFDIPYGGVAQALGETKEISVTDWAKTNRKIGVKALKSLVAVNEPTGLNFIPAIQNADDIKSLNADTVNRIIENLDNIYDCIVIDTGVDSSMLTREALKLSDYIVIVTTATNVSAQNNYRYKEDLIRYGMSQDKLMLFINMIYKTKSDELVEKIAETFSDSGTRVDTIAAVYHDEAIVSARENHKFVCLEKPNSSFAKGINRITKKLGLHTPTFIAEQPKKAPGFLRRLAWWTQ